jgi:hypothetical protein
MIRFASLGLLVAVLLWFGFGFAGTVASRRIARALMDSFDDRPGRAILFLGHSRVYYNDMPDMVRELADAANLPERYQITMRALPSASLKVFGTTQRCNAYSRTSIGTT